MEIILWLIVLLGIGAVIFIGKMGHFRHKLSIIVPVVLLLFIFVTFMNVAHKNSLELRSFGDLFTGLNLYFSWLGHLLGNIGTLTGNAVKMDWIGNSTG
jgi:hypothetical protein